MHRPHVRKIDGAWRVYINDHMHAVSPDYDRMADRAYRIASYARKISMQRDINRIHAALDRIEANR